MYIPTDDDIQMVAATIEAYAIYRSKTGFPLPYDEWLAKEDKKADESGILLW